MISIYIPGFAAGSNERRYGDAQIIHDDKCNAIVIDGGEATLSNKLISYCRSHKITHVTYILTHWHYDHDAGMKAFLDVSGICVDKIYCPPPSELSILKESGVGDDRSRANRRISQANGLKKSIVYPAAGKWTEIQVGEIKCRIWRQKSYVCSNHNYEVNNTSMQTYFPDLYYLTGGDMILQTAFLTALKGNTVKVYKGYHHGNGDGETTVKTLKGYGAELYWYNNVEAKGVAIGASGFSRTGAGQAKKHIKTVLRTDADIVMTAQSGTLRVQKGANTYTYSIPYQGKPVEGWQKSEKGWWYQYADGSYAIGWKQLKWSKGTDWFYFNSSGVMVTGWYYDNNLKAWYYLDPSTGAMQKGKAIKVDGYWYYMDGYGRMLTGWHNPGDGNRYLEPVAGKNQGHMYVNCTAEIDGKTYVFDGYGFATEKTAETVTKPTIIKNTGFKGYNVTKGREKPAYIVIHYVGAESTAASNVTYFNSANRNASADFFVGFAGEICEYNPDIPNQYSWHCGGGKVSAKGGSFYGKCTNKNSIGVELCTKKVNGKWTFSELTLDGAAQLTKWLMQEYGIAADHVIRHYDVTGKNCPGVSGWGYTGGDAEWSKWKARLGASGAAEGDEKPYRVRKSASDVKSQIGAFNSLENAKALAAKNPEYHVYDATGKEII